MQELPLYVANPEHAPKLGALFQREPPNLEALAFFNSAIASRYDVRAQLGAIRAPTLVLTGDHDFFGKAAADEIVAGIPDATLVLLQRAGHFAWLDAPDRFREEVGRFLTT